MELPLHVLKIYQAIESKSSEVYVVGGAVRNYLLDIPIKDYDICTDLKPDYLMNYLKEIGFEVIPTGEKYGTISVIIEKEQVEITTFRIEKNYNNRFPEVEFNANLSEDLARRDFTINAIAYSFEKGFIDTFGGIDDLNNKLIRCVGNGDERFNEDPLRMLRAIRFSTTLNFTIEESTFNSIIRNATLINNISKERIIQELKRIFEDSNYAHGIQELNKSQLLKEIFKSEYLKLNYFPLNDINDFYLRFANFIKDINLENIKDILRELKFDNYLIDRVYCYLKCFYLLRNFSVIDVKKSINEIGKEFYPVFLRFLSHYYDKEILKRVNTIYQTAINNNETINMEELAINGDDLIELGYQGIEVGKIKNYLFEEVLKNNSLNDKETLLAIAQNYYIK